jgi:hypothetical protein
MNDLLVPNKACPRLGIYNFFEKDSQLDLSLEIPDCAFVEYDGPYFLFQVDPKLEGDKWDDQARALGLLFMLLAGVGVGGIAVGCTFSLSPKAIGVLCLVGMTFTRAVFYIVDPYWMEEILPGWLNGIIYGIGYPFLNAGLCCILYQARQSVTSVSSTIRLAAVAICVSEFLTQLIADILRGASVDSPVLVICQAFFIAWGVVLTACFVYVAGDSTHKPVLVLLGLSNLIVALLSVMTIASVGDEFAIMTTEKVFEMLLVAICLCLFLKDSFVPVVIGNSTSGKLTENGL